MACRAFQLVHALGRLLKEKAIVDGAARFKHERLRKARRGLEKLARQGTLFTYLDESLVAGGPVPATNNRIEGGVNRQLRIILNEHRGMNIERRIKALFWWCLAHVECPLCAADIIRDMPTDAQITDLHIEASRLQERDGAILRWGNAVSWHELHATGPYRIDYD